MSNLLKEYIRLSLSEDADDDTFLSFKAQSRSIEKAAKDIGLNVEKVTSEQSKYSVTSEPRERAFRIHLSSVNPPDKSDYAKLATEIISKAFGSNVSYKDMLSAGSVFSGTYDTHVVQDEKGQIYNVIFSGGQKRGQRTGGYSYEDKIRQNLSLAKGKADVRESDIRIETPQKKIVIIEVKGEGARFGQPTLYYSFLSGEREFRPSPYSLSQENAKLVGSILNKEKDNESLQSWLKSIKDAWELVHPNDKMLVLSGQITPEDWKKMKEVPEILGKENIQVKKQGPAIAIDAAAIESYYLKKGANYIQIYGKGLFSFDDILGLGVPKFTAACQSANIAPELSLSGGKLMIRATLNAKINVSSMINLESPQGIQAFISAVQSN